MATRNPMTGPSDIAVRLKDYFTGESCTFPEIGLLQPADPFLDTAGEDLRRRIFITSENGGRNLCLRPEFTIPVCLKHLEEGNGSGRYAYCGTVFRQRKFDAQEFTQAGIEDFGASDFNNADIQSLTNAIGALQAAGENDLELVLGDQAIFVALLEALEIPGAWRKKLVRGFGDKEILGDSLEKISNGMNDSFTDLPAVIRERLDSGNRDAVIDWLADEMASANLPLSGGRTPQAIADRLFEKAELASVKLSKPKRDALEAFLAIDVDIAEAADTLNSFEQTHAISLSGAKQAMLARIEGLADHASALSSMRYCAGFGRRLDYYTGIVFELYRPGLDKPVAGGGRYDRLMTLLGSPAIVPAVGFSIWVDRLTKAGK